MLSLDEAVNAIRSAGGSAEPKRRTGELILRHPLLSKPLTINGRRKDCPRKVLALLHAVERRRKETGGDAPREGHPRR